MSTISNIIKKAKDHYEELDNALTKEYYKQIEELEKKHYVFHSDVSDVQEWREAVEGAAFNEEKRKKIEALEKEWNGKKKAIWEEVDWKEYLKEDLNENEGISIVDTGTGLVIFNNKLFHFYPDSSDHSWDTFLFTRCEEYTIIELPRYLKDGTAYQNLNSLFMDAIFPKEVRFDIENMSNVKNIDNMFNGVKYETHLDLSSWYDLNVKAVDEQTNQIIYGTYTEISNDIKLSPETEEWFNNGSVGDPPASYYTDALTAFRNGAKKLIESYNKESGEVFEPGMGCINFGYGLSALLNKFPDFKIIEPEYESVVYSEKLYRERIDYRNPEKPTEFKQVDEDEECPIKPFNLEKDEEYTSTPNNSDSSKNEEEKANNSDSHKSEEEVTKILDEVVKTIEKKTNNQEEKAKTGEERANTEEKAGEGVNSLTKPKESESELDDSNIFNLGLKNMC